MQSRHEQLNEYKVENPCLKQTVKALIVSNNGEEVFGSNHINNKVKECPRVTEGCQTGEGYHLCKEVCNQSSHAEVDAIKNAKEKGVNLQGATLYLSGHTYCCMNCLENMKNAGIKKAFVFNNEGVCKEYNL